MVTPQKLHTVKWAWLDHEFVPYAEAKVHVFTPGFRYGLGVMEGLRAYWNQTQEQLYIVKLAEHFARLQESAKVIRLNVDYDLNRTFEVLRELIRRNEFKEDLHIRQYIYLGGHGGFDATEPVGTFIVGYPRGRIHNVSDGIHCCISSWQRIADHSLPARVKLGANYANSRLAKMEAAMDGYDDAIMLTQTGKISETSAAALLMIREGKLVIPSRTSGVLESITRQVAIDLLDQERGLTAVERDVDRTELYVAQELFACGTGMEVTPVVSVDRLPVADGQPGPATRWLQERYSAIVRGNVPEHLHWLTPMY